MGLECPVSMWKMCVQLTCAPTKSMENYPTLARREMFCDTSIKLEVLIQKDMISVHSSIWRWYVKICILFDIFFGRPAKKSKQTGSIGYIGGDHPYIKTSTYMVLLGLNTTVDENYIWVEARFLNLLYQLSLSWLYSEM